MPMYEYVCKTCGTRFEKLVRMGAEPQALICPTCTSTVVDRAFSTFATSGGGSQRGSTEASCGPVG